MTQLGELRRVGPGQVWADEARDFTPWMAENLSQLGEALGMDLELSGREAPVDSCFHPARGSADDDEEVRHDPRQTSR